MVQPALTRLVHQVKCGTKHRAHAQRVLMASKCPLTNKSVCARLARPWTIRPEAVHHVLVIQYRNLTDVTVMHPRDVTTWKMPAGIALLDRLWHSSNSVNAWTKRSSTKMIGLVNPVLGNGFQSMHLQDHFSDHLRRYVPAMQPTIRFLIVLMSSATLAPRDPQQMAMNVNVQFVLKSSTWLLERVSAGRDRF